MDGALKTGYGGGWGRYDGVLFKYSKSRATQQITPLETLCVSFLARDRVVRCALFWPTAARRPSQLDPHLDVFRDGRRWRHAAAQARARHGLSSTRISRTARLPVHLVSRPEAWHCARGIPWKLGVGAYGPPGTGKTSLIHALASDFGFDINM